MARMKPTVLDYISSIIPKENISFQVPMKKHTTFKVGGEADVYIRIDNVEILKKLIPYLYQENEDYFILGKGSNILVSEKGYRGIVIEISSGFSGFYCNGTTITVESGALLSKIAKVALEYELTGMEFAAGIPGSVGGAMVMNAGAYGGDMEQIVESIKVLDHTGNILELTNDQILFDYRTSIMKQRPLVVLETTFHLEKGNKEDIQGKMADIAAKRLEKQPINFPSAGSTFKRPDGYFAGKLIMDAGLRGLQIGGAQVSKLHCGFVINTGNATATDIYHLIQQIQRTVFEKFNVQLESEIIMLGEF